MLIMLLLLCLTVLMTLFPYCSSLNDDASPAISVV